MVTRNAQDIRMTLDLLSRLSPELRKALTKGVDYFNLLHEQPIWRIVKDLKSAEKDYGIKGMAELALRLEKEVRNIRIKESLEGLAMPETYIEYEIGDSASYEKGEELLLKSLKWALKKEKMIGRTDHVIFPSGAYAAEFEIDRQVLEEEGLEVTQWSSVADFEVFDRTGQKMKAIGMVRGLGDYDKDMNKVFLNDIVITHFERVEPEHPGVMYPRGY